MESQNFLREKYRLQNSEEVKSAAKRTEERTGKKLHANTSEGADARIQNYLERLSNIINPPNIEEYPNFDRKQRNLEMLKRDMHKQFVIKFEDIPEAYFDSIKRKHREEGYGDIEIPYEYRKELAQTIITDQERSLDNWVEYLTSDDAKYPDWLRY